MTDQMTLDFARIAQDLQIRKVQVESVVQLLDEGNTVPFITRYRKERTGGLNEDVIRKIEARVGQLRQLADRKQTILKSIEGQGKLTEELRAAILAAEILKGIEDKEMSDASAAWSRSRCLSGTATRPLPTLLRCCPPSSTPRRSYRRRSRCSWASSTSWPRWSLSWPTSGRRRG
jgi:hypothetical protein